MTLSGETEEFDASSGDPLWIDEAKKKLKPGVKVPAVVYLHGCRGIGDQASQYKDFLLPLGYAVLMPDSFERPGREACRAAGSLDFRIELRSDEIAVAAAEVRKIAWIDQKKVILMGWSEGGNSIDTWSEGGFSAHINLGSACTKSLGSPIAPEGTPVLSIVGEYDDYRPGKSCSITRKVGGSKSITISGGGHAIAHEEETKEAIKAFLSTCCS